MRQQHPARAPLPGPRSEMSSGTASEGVSVPGGHNLRLGARGEALAAAYLEGRGYRVLARNWRTREGELDIVAQDGDAVVAVEVKTRGGTGFGHPLEAVTARKAKRLRRLLLSWVRSERPGASRLRIDAIGITMRLGAPPRIDHVEGLS